MAVTAAEDKLRRSALVWCMVQTVATCVLPAVAYYYVFRLDNYGVGPQAWMIWGSAIFTGLLGVMAHGAANNALTTAHLVVTTLLAAAIGGYASAWSFIIELQCSVSQASFIGCEPSTCPCTATGTCTEGDLSFGGCSTCLAVPAPLCEAVRKTSSMYLLAFTGLAAVVAAIPSLCIDVQILMAVGAQHSAGAARIQATVVAVEQQTRLIAAGDKPTVTPGTLSDWVSSLLASEDDVGHIAGERCMNALRGRGYELPIKINGKYRTNTTGNSSTSSTTTRTMTFPARPSTGSLFRSATLSSAAEGGGMDAIDAAERGGPGTKRPKKQQVTPEETPEIVPIWVPMTSTSG